MPCSYCPSPDTITCQDCQQSFCHTFRGTTLSHVVFHLTKTQHRRVGQDSIWKCCFCGEENAFNLSIVQNQDEFKNDNFKFKPIIINDYVIVCSKCKANASKLIDGKSFSVHVRKQSEMSSEEESTESDSEYENSKQESQNRDENQNNNVAVEDINQEAVNQKQTHILSFSSYKEYTHKMLQMLKKENEYEKLNKKKMARNNVNVIIQESNNKVLAIFEYPRAEDQIRVSVGDEIHFELSVPEIDQKNKDGSQSTDHHISKKEKIGDPLCKSIDSTNTVINKEPRKNSRFFKGFILNDTLDDTYTAELSVPNYISTPQSNYYNLIFPYRNVGYLRMKKAVLDFKKKCSKEIFNEIIESDRNNTLLSELREKYSKPYHQLVENILHSRNYVRQPNNLPLLNNSQIIAIENTFNRGVTLIQGPPGTGKTVTSVSVVYNMYYNEGFADNNITNDSNETNNSANITHYFKQLLNTNKHSQKHFLHKIKEIIKKLSNQSKILVVAPSNIAVDNLSRNMVMAFSENVHTHDKEDSTIHYNDIRYGRRMNSMSLLNKYDNSSVVINQQSLNNMVIPSFFLNNFSYSNILRIVSRNREGLVSDLDNMTLHHKVEVIIKELNEHLQLKGVNETKKNEKRVKDMVVEWCYLYEFLVYILNEKNSVKDNEKDKSSSGQSSVENKDSSDRSSIDQQSVDQKQLLDQLTDKQKNSTIQEYKNIIMNRISSLKSRIEKHATSKLLKYALRYYLLTNSKIVISTCVTAGQPLFYHFEFPYVIIDEAVQATEPLSIIPLCYGAKRVVAVGDHRQLGPTILSCKTNDDQSECIKETINDLQKMSIQDNQNDSHSKDEHINNILLNTNTVPLKTSLFERLIKNNHIPFLLSVQYRMDPLLCEWVSNTFYNGMVKSYHTVYEDTGNKHNLPKTFFYNSPYRESYHNSSYLNLREGIIINELISYLNKCRIKNNKIAVITPYEAQRNYLNNILNTNYNDIIEIANVDAFQGREKDYIIISLVRSNKECEIGFLKSKRRMNVALTRGKKGVWIIGNVRTYYYGKRHKGESKYTLWHSLIQWYMKRGLLLEGEIENLRKIEGKNICFGDIIRDSKEC